MPPELTAERFIKKLNTYRSAEELKKIQRAHYMGLKQDEA